MSTGWRAGDDHRWIYILNLAIRLLILTLRMKIEEDEDLIEIKDKEDIELAKVAIDDTVKEKKKKALKSKVWNFFERLPEGPDKKIRSKCKKCGKEYIAESKYGTGNMTRHLKVCRRSDTRDVGQMLISHENGTVKIIDLECETVMKLYNIYILNLAIRLLILTLRMKIEEDEDLIEIKDKEDIELAKVAIDDTVKEKKKKALKSKVWNFFERLPEGPDKKIRSKCKKCGKEYIAESKYGTGNMTRHLKVCRRSDTRDVGQMLISHENGTVKIIDLECETVMKLYNFHLKLRNITPTSVERVSLSLNDFFSGETTPDTVKFKTKGGSKFVGQPGLMDASSSSAHENVSRVEFEELKKSISVVVSQQGILMKSVAEMNKKLDILIEVDDAKKSDPVEPVSEIKQSEQSQVVEEKIDVDATIASAVKTVENLIGSSTHVPASVETSEKNDLEMVVFQETPILRPQKRDRKKGAHIDIIFYYLRKKIMYSAEPKIKVTTTDCLFCSSITSLYEKFVEKNNDISMLSLSHNVAQYIRGGKILCATPWHLVDHVVMPINVKLQDHWICGRLNIAERRIYLYNSLRSGSDCGVFVASFAEYFIDGKPIPSSGFDVEIHRDRLVVLFYHYGMKKQLENIESESEAPPSLPKK
ncbi:hypothetical protein F8388_005413 [Cannabis sativa]|uniref:BED-type domain-containing protein n=1 Tax=Cannabis sativa TaxID=3483 RepID=A0A7J6HAL7_CANSA|nr:hypothetical protein F8388_005413 [Cannabis sativa]